MGVRLKNRYGIFIVLLISFYSCGTTNSSVKEKECKDWVEAYKSTAFMACLQESYGKDFKTLLDYDQSISANYDILNKDYEKAKQYGLTLAKNINEYPEESDFSGKKNVINSCLFYYNSKDLDSIAKAEYKKYLKGLKVK